VTVSNNTISGSDDAISVFDLTVLPNGAVTVRGSTITGGDRGIVLAQTIGTLVEDNKTSGAASFSLQAEGDANGNTSGQRGERHERSRELRLPRRLGRKQEPRHREPLDRQHRRDRLARRHLFPQRRRSRAVAVPEPPPVDINPPAVIVPPIGDQVDEAAAGQPVPPEILNPEQPPQPGGPVARRPPTRSSPRCKTSKSSRA
jgi:hypothetical protein